MKSFTYFSPTKYIFGKDSINRVGEEVKEHSKGKVLIVHSNSSKKSGLVKKIIENLEQCNIEHIEYGKAVGNPTSELVYEGIEIGKNNKIDFILAIGGGSPIDLAKAIAVGILDEGDFWDYFQGKEIKKAVNLGVVLTIAASGSESSPNAIITNEKTLDKTAIESDLIRPKFSIMDPELTMTLSKFQTACGLTDIFSHCLERYFTNTQSVGLTDRLLESIMATLLVEGKRVVENPNDYDASSNIMWAGTLSHNDIIGCDRQQDWNTHHMEHVLSAKYNCVHGAGIAVMFPARMKFVVEKHGKMRFAQFANRVFGIEMDFENPYNTAIKGIQAFENFLIDIGMPVNFEQLGIPEDEIDELVKLNGVGEGKTSGFYSLTSEDIKEIYMLAVNNKK